MEDKIRTALIGSLPLLFLALWPIYIAITNFNIERFIDFRESTIKYINRIGLIILINLLIILLKSLPFKKPKFLTRFLNKWKVIIFIIMFIYPFLPDFQNRFGKIIRDNVTDFYAIILPILIMFIIISLTDASNQNLGKKIKNNSLKKRKIDALIKKSRAFTNHAIMLLILVGRICIIKKSDILFQLDFILYPLAICCFSLSISLGIYAIYGNKKY